MKTIYALFPVYYGLSPVLILLSINTHELWSLKEFLILLLISFSISIVSLIISRMIFPDRNQADIIASISLFLFFSYGYFSLLVWNISFSLVNREFGRDNIMITLWFIIFSFIIIVTFKTKKSLRKVSSFLNIFGLLLIIIPLITIFFSILFSTTRATSLKEKELISLQINQDSIKLPLRDIYYIILDRYARADILKQVYNYDNSEFLSTLQNRGFYIANNSYANYPRTGLSLASSLNMQYINHLTITQDENSKNSRPVCDLINNHALGRALKLLGYRYLHFGSYHAFTRHSDIADINCDKYMIPEFSLTFYKTTLLFPFLEKLQVLKVNTSTKNSILFKFSKIQEVPDIKKLTFVFAHFLLPHLPYIFV